PLITSTGNGLKEIAGEAAVLVDPREHSAIAAALGHVLQNEDVKTSLGQKGLERSKMYSWEKCANETLDVLENCR
ncbi:MAG: glycosyltransferase family 1 protein, partial [Rhodothermales bacterium]|nr:glycosyltransferase family 1 protein [Rhodothermales bacterium]